MARLMLLSSTLYLLLTKHTHSTLKRRGQAVQDTEYLIALLQEDEFELPEDDKDFSNRISALYRNFNEQFYMQLGAIFGAMNQDIKNEIQTHFPYLYNPVFNFKPIKSGQNEELQILTAASHQMILRFQGQSSLPLESQEVSTFFFRWAYETAQERYPDIIPRDPYLIYRQHSIVNSDYFKNWHLQQDPTSINRARNSLEKLQELSSKHLIVFFHPIDTNIKHIFHQGEIDQYLHHINQIENTIISTISRSYARDFGFDCLKHLLAQQSNLKERVTPSLKAKIKTIPLILSEKIQKDWQSLQRFLMLLREKKGLYIVKETLVEIVSNYRQLSKKPGKYWTAWENTELFIAVLFNVVYQKEIHHLDDAQMKLLIGDITHTIRVADPEEPTIDIIREWTSKSFNQDQLRIKSDFKNLFLNRQKHVRFQEVTEKSEEAMEEDT